MMCFDFESVGSLVVRSRAEAKRALPAPQARAMPDGADLNAATIKGDLEKVKELLAAGVSPDYSDKAHVRCFKDTPIKCTSLTF